MKKVPIKKKIAMEVDAMKRKKEVRGHRLTNLQWECTVRCNLNCLHCGGDCRVINGVTDMPAADFMHVLESIACNQDTEAVEVTLVGGEPLLRSDLLECGRQIRARGFKWGITTNGTLLTAELLSQMVDAGLNHVNISLDGMRYEHNWLHGADSFDLASDAIKAASNMNGVRCTVITHVNIRNFDYLSDLRNHLVALGSVRWILKTVVPTDATEAIADLQLESYQMRQLMQFIVRERHEGTINISYSCESFLGGYEGEVRDGFFRCNAGISRASISVNGDIGGCLCMRHGMPQGNIYEGDEFIDVWNTCFTPFRNRSWMQTGACTHCKVFRYCRGGSMHLRDAQGNIMRCDYYRV